MKKSNVTESMRRLMSPENRAWVEENASFPGQARPQMPAPDTVSRLEKEEHRIFRNWLLLNGFAFRHSRTDKATREEVGAPDFSVYEKPVPGKRLAVGRSLCIEFKRPGGRMSQEQERWATKYGATVHVLHTAGEAIELVRLRIGHD